VQILQKEYQCSGELFTLFLVGAAAWVANMSEGNALRQLYELAGRPRGAGAYLRER
jgi:hypothetical protein